MFTLPSQPQGIGQVLDSGFRLYAASLKYVLGLSLLANIVPVPFSMFFESMKNLMPEAPGMISTTSIINLAVLGVVTWILAIVLMAAIYYRQGSVAVASPVTLRDSFVRGFQCLWPLFAATVLWLLASTLGLALLILPGIFLMLALGFYAPAVVLDQDGPLQALKHSFRLVKGNWWRSMAVLSVPVLIVIAVSIAVVMALVPVLVGYGGLDSDASGLGMSLLAQGADVVLGTFLDPLLTAVVIAQYHDLKLRREGTDLEARIAETG
jgi:hypothetical protein